MASRKKAPAPVPHFEMAALTADDPGAGFVGELRESTDPTLKDHGAGKLELYETLHRDYQVFATLQQRRSRVTSRELKVDPGGDSMLDVAAADSLRSQLAALPFDRISKRMLAGILNGYAVGECLYDHDVATGGVRLANVKVRRASRFRQGVDGRLRLIRGSDPIVMPARKFWQFVAGAEDDDDPYGRGLGHWLYWPVWFKRNSFRYWALFLERFAIPTPHAKVPVGTPKDKMQEVAELLSKITSGGRVVVPANVIIEFLNAMKDSGGDFEKFIALQDASISKIVLSQTMTTDDGSSLSQSSTHADVATMIAIEDGSLLSDSFMAGPAKWLTEWNFPGAATPLVYRDFAEPEDLDKAADRTAKIYTVGYRPTPEKMREMFGEGYEPIPAPAIAPGGPAFAEPRLPGGADAVSELMATGWRQVMGPEIDAIEKLLDGSRSLEDVRSRLGDLAVRDPDALVDGLSRVMFSARVAGEADGPLDLDDEAELG